MKSGRGVFVRDVGAAASINIQVSIAKVNFLELLDVRRTLEIRAIQLAVIHGKDKDIDDIERALLAIEDKVRKGVVPADEDVEFHHAIYRAGHNRTLFELTRPLADSFQSLWEPFNRKAELIMETLPLHRPLFEGIKNRDTTKAVEAFNSIIDMDEKKIIGIYNSLTENFKEKSGP